MEGKGGRQGQPPLYVYSPYSAQVWFTLSWFAVVTLFTSISSQKNERQHRPKEAEEDNTEQQKEEGKAAPPARERDNATPIKERGEAGPTGYFKYINFMARQKKEWQRHAQEAAESSTTHKKGEEKAAPHARERETVAPPKEGKKQATPHKRRKSLETTRPTRKRRRKQHHPKEVEEDRTTRIRKPSEGRQSSTISKNNGKQRHVPKKEPPLDF